MAAPSIDNALHFSVLGECRQVKKLWLILSFSSFRMGIVKGRILPFDNYPRDYLPGR
jgi:hypothetical protein